MKNLNKDEHSNFEKSWKDAFEGAELEPSEDIWVKIDGALANQESKGFKKAIIFYRYAAAVSLLLLLSTVVVSYYFVNFQYRDNNISTNNTPLKEEVQHQELFDEKSNMAQQDANDGNKNENGSSNENLEKNTIDKQDADMPRYLSRNEKTDEIEEEKKYSIADKKGSAKKTLLGEGDRDKIKNRNHTTGDIQKGEQALILPDNVAANDVSDTQGPIEEGKRFDYRNERAYSEKASLAYLESMSFNPFIIEREVLQKEIFKVPINQKKAKDSDISQNSRYFAGLQFSPGVFDPNFQAGSGNNATIADFANFPSLEYDRTLSPMSYQEQDPQPQVSYTYGMNFGLKVAKRWLVNLGLQYARNNTSGTTQQYFSSDENKMYLATPLTLNNFSNESLRSSPSGNLPINPKEYTENYEFASIPLKAGFIIIDKKISWILSTGIATDFFIKSESQSSSGDFSTLTNNAGESSQFRSMFFNGLASSEIIYHLTKNYSISLEPSFRTAINSFSKSESLITSHPQSFGIAAGFRYNF